MAIYLLQKFYIQTLAEPYYCRFVPNFTQIQYHKHSKKRDLILKARRHGISTDIQLNHLNFALTNNDVNCLTIANTVGNAQKLFKKVSYAFSNLPEELQQIYKPDLENTGEIQFKLNKANIRVATSGRSDTIHRLHISEFSHMPKKQKEEVLTGSMEAVPVDGYVALETTAKGYDEFHELYMQAKKGKNGWNPIFLPWFINPLNQLEPVEPDWKNSYRILSKQFELIPDIQERFNLTDNQFYWYYSKGKDLRRLLKQEYPTVDEEAFMSTSSAVFDLFTLQSIQPQAPLLEYSDTELSVWEPPLPEHKYIIGVDTSEGNANGDFSVIAILDIDTGKQVARYRNRIKDYLLAKEIFDLASLYNQAYVVIERNNHGHSVINSLLNEYNYRRQYRTEDGKFGFLTTSKTKVDMLLGTNGLEKAIFEGDIIVNDEIFLHEARSFEVKDSGEMGASEGDYDDTVIANAIAWYCRGWVMKKSEGSGIFSFD